MDSCALKQSTQESVKGEFVVQMHLPTISPPLGLEHLANLAQPGRESQDLHNRAKLHQPPCHFSSSLQRPPGFFAYRCPPPPVNFNFPYAWQPEWPLGWHVPHSAQQPWGPPGHWDSISLASTASTAESTPILGSPHRDPYVASDDDGMLQFPKIVHSLMKKPNDGKCFDEEFNDEVSNHDVDVCPSLLDEENRAESKEQHVQVDTGACTINWRVDAKKVSSMERQIVSPNFQISKQASVKIMLKAKVVGSKRGHASFRNSCGFGSVEVKLVEGLAGAPQLRFCVSVGDEPHRGPVGHDFGNSSVCGLPKDIEEWDFSSSVDPRSSTLLVSLHVLNVTSSNTYEEDI